MAWTETTRNHYARKRWRYASDMTDCEWALMAPFLPQARRLCRPRTTCLRDVVNALLYIAGTAPTLTQVGPHVFGSYPADNQQGAVLATYARDRGFERVWLVKSPDSAYTLGGPEYFGTAFEALGGKVVGESLYSLNQPDFSAIATTIKTADPAPDVIVTWAWEPDFPAFVKALRGAGVDTRVMGGDVLDTPTVRGLGEIMTFGGYGVFLALAFGFPPFAALIVGLSTAVVVALAMERVAFRAMRGADVVSLLITSFAVSEILKVLFQNGISARPVPIAFPAAWSGTYRISGITFGVVPTVSILVTLTALAGLTFLLRRTVAEDIEMLRLLGIRANRVVATAFALSGLLAGVAAVVWTAQRGSVDPMMGFFPVLKAFIATVLGGLGSLGGAVLGGFVIGAFEVLAEAFLPEALAPYRDAIVLVAVISALLWRPDGLLPAAKTNRS